MSPLLRTHEVAALLAVSQDTVARLVQSGKIKRCFPSPGCPRIARAEVDRYIAEISGSPAPAIIAPVAPSRLTRAEARRLLMKG
ncbi:helix-turn-helix transcriptional regulator [Candidatus Contendibacter odensensis]|uniref:Helix-turn-helix domain-containing protein n=1 Tax=Candidatus Contendobacter odensis Run_B_J11 TaxID=1400861 RepID=A0A7U7GES7_9GAMM|nr:helix-turn-helix domain-containing protein [Candidatus Contendobacter odensis]CDH46992.1 hypothetical protein BN874_690042 [Candidatus Contendobacter odensis Run_B_J11]